MAQEQYEVPGPHHYQAVLNPDDHDLSPAQHEAYRSTVHEPFGQLMAHWLPLNKALRAGRVPLALVKQAAFASAAMPDMSQPAQVRHYGHLMDMVNEGMDPASPSDEHVGEFARRAMSPEFPRWNRAHYELNTPAPGRVMDPNTDLPQVEGLRRMGDRQTLISRLSHAHRADASAKEWAAGGVGRFATALLGAGNAPVYDHQGKVTDREHQQTDGLMANHPALAHVLENYDEHFKDQPDQAMLPAVWLHRLVAPHHDRLTSGAGFGGEAPHAMLADLANSYRKHGVHADQLAKGEYPPSIHGRVLQAVEESRQKHGAVAALMGYHLHGVPALLAADNGAGLLKMEVTVELLRKSAEEVAARQPKVVHFLGQAIVPGTARSSKGDYHILGEDDTHYLAMPAKGNDLVRLPKKKENTHFQVLAPLKRVSDKVLDADAHGVAAFNTSPDQRALIHSADVSKWEREAPKHARGKGAGARDGLTGWVKAAHGKSAFIKTSGYPVGAQVPSHARNDETEGIFHNVARDVFGLGQYVPTTAVFDHPATGQRHSIQEGVPYAEHVSDKLTPRQKKIFQATADRGDLDKMALMDGIMGSRDRHKENYLLSRTGMHLIDNASMFSQGLHIMPHYWDSHYGPRGLREPLHPEAVRWAQGLDADKLESHLRRYGVGKIRLGMGKEALGPAQAGDRAGVVDLPKEAARRVRALQGLLHGTDGNVSRIKAYHSTLNWDQD